MAKLDEDVTATRPLVAPLGTVVEMDVAVELMTVAAMPLNVTELEQGWD